MSKTEIINMLTKALNDIASYGEDGICPYGCDTPHIAQQTLIALKQEVVEMLPCKCGSDGFITQNHYGFDHGVCYDRNCNMHTEPADTEAEAIENWNKASRTGKGFISQYSGCHR